MVTIATDDASVIRVPILPEYYVQIYSGSRDLRGIELLKSPCGISGGTENVKATGVAKLGQLLEKDAILAFTAHLSSADSKSPHLAPWRSLPTSLRSTITEFPNLYTYLAGGAYQPPSSRELQASSSIFTIETTVFFSPSHSMDNSALFLVYRALCAKPPSTLCAKSLHRALCNPVVSHNFVHPVQRLVTMTVVL
ncbi:hypothetical protein TNCV_4383741 [Trichonephila clavipes]|nr:hypothetical protein TNCV_4383741 [Trichonephila clavipes]